MKVIVEIEMNVDNATYRNPHNDSKVDEIAVITSIKESLKNAYMLNNLNK